MRGTGGGEDYDTFAAFFEMRDGKFGEKERSLDETVIGCVPNLRSNILQFLANIVKTGIMGYPVFRTSQCRYLQAGEDLPAFRYPPGPLSHRRRFP